MARGTLIALVGIDGSGKSTQAARLAQALRARGHRARAFENGGGRPIIDGLAHRLGRADGAALIGRHGRVGTELWLRSLGITRCIAWARATGGIAVMDRYAHCQLATMHARGDQLTAPLARRLAAAAPRPDLLLWCAVDPAIAQQRVLARGRDEETIDWLTAFDGAYRQLLPPTATHVDANGTADAVHAQLVELTLAALPPRG